eukprot:TRINITY_DN3418_c0_g2_i1.p2 TRINITY_DN3418_c0_g2~~TRINITY_DN3418_c0_g2_i1.p2  ORF type:complete len:151 (+),score=29.68 TRINITY_DN3418_c0_g2_i1:25-453(+)
MIRRPPRSTPLYSSAASDVYKRQLLLYGKSSLHSQVSVRIKVEIKEESANFHDLVSGSKTNLIALIVKLQETLDNSIRTIVIDKLFDESIYSGKSQAEVNEVRQSNAILKLYLMYYQEHKELLNCKAFFQGCFASCFLLICR